MLQFYYLANVQSKKAFMLNRGASYSRTKEGLIETWKGRTQSVGEMCLLYVLADCALTTIQVHILLKQHSEFV